MAEAKKGITKEEAVKHLKEEEAKTTEDCRKKVSAALEEYGCTFDVAMIVRQDGNAAQVSVVLKK